ncbi:MAG: S1 RNA-binding domain-containing protein, partial [Planctomycetota bacterium]|nr:S1 RNA-binding domain-containing protein [Planctomycetota bacterium]
LEDGLEGLLHISELSDQKVEDPEQVVNVGDDLEVKILRVDTEERKIGLSRKRVEWTEDQEAASASDSGGSTRTSPTAGDLKGGLGAGGPLITPATGESESTED